MTEGVIIAISFKKNSLLIRLANGEEKWFYPPQGTIQKHGLQKGDVISFEAYGNNIKILSKKLPQGSKNPSCPHAHATSLKKECLDKAIQIVEICLKHGVLLNIQKAKEITSVTPDEVMDKIISVSKRLEEYLNPNQEEGENVKEG